MGLSASQARVLLLTSKNDALELQAQLISNERLLLAQEQERIANEYSDATGNEIWTCTVRDPEKNDGKGTSQENLSLRSLAKSYEGSDVPIYVKYGDTYYGIKATFNQNATDPQAQWTYEYYEGDVPIPNPDFTTGAWKALTNATSYASAMQVMARNNTLEILIPIDSDTSEMNSSKEKQFEIDGQMQSYVRKAPDSLATVSSRYYTEDDANAEAAYNTAMAKVNAIDKRLENKLNQIETQKKAVETELESSKNLVKTNEERTFKYFS